MSHKILVVEDEAIIAEDIALRLEKMGYEVVDIVASGEEAIAAAAIHQPDLVLMDIMLQGLMDGIMAADKIRETLEIPVVYLTAYADENTLKRAKVTQPLGYILKPFRETELWVTIEIALSRHQAELEVKKAVSTAEKKRDNAEEVSKIKAQYLSMAAHEFRNPLTTIQSSAELIQEYVGNWPPEKTQKHLEQIVTATESLNQLLEDILKFGKADFQKTSLNPAPLNLASFCEGIVETFQLSAGNEYRLIFTQKGESRTAYLDQKLLWHLFNNLIANAIKYSPAGGEILITLSFDFDEVVFQICDRGIGIDPEEINTLFVPFSRASNVGTIPGTGLGLAIAKRSVDLHQGQITVESQLGQGTTFTVTLPLNPVL
ncbi:ATP-binding protein [Laspinema sp. A4]|uniref:hybrid sensor histidine kinase/response regulator n=1 Tax=Laspinema sp. D2d TaxID=2953686 RepID=UPI0021BA9365|nr:ATP-binding protein [Laspinema sp. D2d]MCT7983401.1 ATP-binding protein [Laspinema sp. D2d]